MKTKIALGITIGMVVLIGQTKLQFPQQAKFGISFPAALIGSSGQLVNVGPGLTLTNNTLSAVTQPPVPTFTGYIASSFTRAGLTFTLPGGAVMSTMLVFKNGILQEETVDYTRSGANVTFAFEVVDDDRVRFLVQK